MVRATPALFKALEKKKLIRTLAPSKKLLRTRTEDGTVDGYCRSKASSGPHVLMGVAKRTTKINLSYHDGSEEIILTNFSSNKYKPLYLIMGLSKAGIISKKIRNGKLSGKDLVAVKLDFGDARFSAFSVLKDTVHWEATEPGKGLHPIFFVSEPAGLKMKYFRGIDKYEMSLANKR